MLQSISSLEDMETVLLMLMTDKEMSAFVNRIKILELLNEKVPHREIASSLGVGVVTVTRGARVFNEDDFAILKKYID